MFSTRALRASLVVLTAAALVAPGGTPAEAHKLVSEPHLPGTLTITSGDPKCGTDASKIAAGVPTDSTCAGFTITGCSNGTGTIPDRKGFYAKSLATGTLRGMVVMFSGGPGKEYWGEGTEFELDANGNPSTPAYHFITDLRAAGFDVVQIRWGELGWAASGEGVDAGAHVACRPATAIKWVKDNLYLSTPHAIGVCGFCTLGSSGGSAQVTWPLSHYGGDAIVDAVFPTGGPTHAAMRKGCVREVGYEYGGSTIRQIDGLFGYTSKSSTSPWFEDKGPCFTKVTSAPWPTKWDEAGIDTGGNKYDYLATRVHVVVGASDVEMRNHSLDYALGTWNAGSPYVIREVVAGMGHAVSLYTAGMAALKSAVLATTASGMRALTVTTPTNGSVASGDGQLSCPPTCISGFMVNTEVTLTATPNAGYQVGTWTGCTTVIGSQCTVTMSDNKTVSVTFDPAATNPVLTVTKNIAAGGTVTDDLEKINCGATCSASYTSGDTVTLTAAKASGYVFTGWTGACSNTSGTCVVTMNGNQSVQATFAAITHLLTVTKDVGGTGTGTVTSSPAGIDCGEACEAPFEEGSNVTLTATPASDSVFTAWGGACESSGSNPQCIVSMTTAQGVTATFDQAWFSLTVTVAGAGAGSVSSDVQPGILDCRDGTGTCQADFLKGTQIRLTAVPDVGSQAGGFVGTCESGTDVCTFTIQGPSGVTATFNPAPTTQTLTVDVVGPGSVSSAPSGITDCRESTGTCGFDFPANDDVTLTATADTGASFAGFTGGCTSSTSPCVVTMDASKTVVATFTSGPPPLEVTITDTGFTPKNPPAIVIGRAVRWTSSATSTREHSAKDNKNLGTGSTPLFNSGPLQPGQSYIFPFQAAGLYTYVSGSPGDSTYTATISVALAVTPLTGSTATIFSLTWASAAMDGYGFDVEYRHKPDGGTYATWKKLGGSLRTQPSGTFDPDLVGTYQFRTRLKNTVTSVLSGWSPVVQVSVT